jgi:hypothetical protein
VATSPNQPPEQSTAAGPPAPIDGHAEPPPPPPRARQARRLGVLAALSSKTGRHVFLIIGLLVFIGLSDWYTSYIADGKASDWLTSYNGLVTTNAIGKISADLDSRGTALPTPSAKIGPGLQAARGTDSAVAVLARQVGTTGNQPGLTANATPPADTTGAGAADPSTTPIPPPTEAETLRLQDQLQTIRDRIRHHGTVMAYFYEKYYGAITMVMIAGVIVAVTLFFIAQKGWDNASSYVKAIFVVMSAAAAFYGLLPPVFEQEKNITDNKELFLQYKVLESELGSYPLTHTTVKNEPKPAKDFINYIDAEMARIGNIAVGFDITKVNYKNAIDLNKNPEATPSASPAKVGRPSTPPAARKKG